MKKLAFLFFIFLIYRLVQRFFILPLGPVVAFFYQLAFYIWLYTTNKDTLLYHLEKTIRKWRKQDHESGIPMAEWEERQRQKALDEKLTNGKYTKAEKEHLIYTANLSTDKKDTLREKHLGQKKKPPVTHL